MQSNYASYPGYEIQTLCGYKGQNVALLEDVECGLLVYLIKTPRGYEEDAYFFNGTKLVRTGAWFPLDYYPEYAACYDDENERHIVMRQDMIDFRMCGPNSFIYDPEEGRDYAA